MRLLITGGSGYLGSELARLAPPRGWATTATFHSQKQQTPGVASIRLDVRDAHAVARAVADLRPDVVIHTAYVQSGPDLWPITVEGTGAVARAGRECGARLIHLSSDVIFDGEREGAYTEEDPPVPISDYGAAKAAAERLVAEIDPAALIVRTSLIYGGAALSKHEALALDAADGRADVTFFTDELRCPIAVGDLAAALLELAAMDLGGCLHVAGTETVSRHTFAQLVAAAHGRDPQQVRGGVSPPGGRRPRNCALDTTRARRVLATRLRGVREVLRPPHRPEHARH